MDEDPVRAVRRLLVSYAKTHPWTTAAGVASTLVTPIQDILLPHMTGRVVNAIKEAGESPDDPEKASAVMWAFVAVGVAISVVQLAYLGVDVIDATTVPVIMTHVRRRMLRCVLDSNDTSQAGELETGDLLTKFVKVPLTVANWYEAVKGMVPNALVYVFATVYFWWIDPVLGVALLVGVVATFAAFVVNLKSCGGVSEERDLAFNRLHERIDEVLHNLPAIFASGQKVAEQRALRPLEELAERLYFKTVWCATGVKAWMVPTALLMVAVMLWRSLKLLRAGTMSAGQFVAIFGVILYLMTSMMRIVQNSRSMVYYWGIIKASVATLGDECGQKMAAGGVDARRDVDPRAPIVEIQAVTFVHSSKGSTTAASAALDTVSLSIRRGERVALVGRMGTGKTTLVRLIMRLLEPTSGRILMRGVPYDDLDVDTVRREFGYVPQGAALFDRSVLDNAFYGVPSPKPEVDREKVFWDAARELGVDQVLSALPEGSGTPAGKSGSRLSGGQRQAVWLVRMRLLGPSVLVLDEPTSAMDPESRAAVSRAIARFRTVVFVTHDESFVDAVATRRVTLSAGRIVGDVTIVGGTAHEQPEQLNQENDTNTAEGLRRRLVDEGLIGAVRFSYV